VQPEDITIRKWEDAQIGYHHPELITMRVADIPKVHVLCQIKVLTTEVIVHPELTTTHQEVITMAEAISAAHLMAEVTAVADTVAEVQEAAAELVGGAVKD